MRRKSAALKLLGIFLLSQLLQSLFFFALLFFDPTLDLLWIEASRLLRIVLLLFNFHKVLLGDEDVSALLLLVIKLFHQFAISLIEVGFPFGIMLARALQVRHLIR